MRPIYLDNAATSYPKPRTVAEAMVRYLEEVGGNPGRGVHGPGTEASGLVYDTRRSLARLLGVSDPSRIVFTSNATQALNMALSGLLRPSDHVVATSMEHNAVARPLRALQRRLSLELEIVAADAEGFVEPAALARAVRPDTRLVVVCHGSNVTGALQDLPALKEVCGKVPLLVDAAQTAGGVPLRGEAWDLDMVAVTGHKSLLGPQGTGALYVRPGLDVEPLIRGGTGSASESDEQPSFWPDRMEAGTLNGVGIAGLKAGVDWIFEQGVDRIRSHEQTLRNALWEGLSKVPGVQLYGPREPDRSVGVLSFRLAGYRVDEVGFLLDREFGIAVRVGLHCAPWAHGTIGTHPEGTVRASVGPMSTEDDVTALVEAVGHLASRRGGP